MALVDDLTTQRDALVAALAALPIAPDYNIEGQAVSWSQQRTALLEQIKQLDQLIALAGGPVVFESQGTI